MRGDQWPTAHTYMHYSGGSNTLKYKTNSSPLKSGMTLTALYCQRRIITSQPLYPKFQSINCPKKFPAFRPVEETVGATLAAAAHIKVAATAAASTVTRGRSTQVITRIGQAWENPLARKRVASIVQTHTRKMYRTTSVRSTNYHQPLLKWKPASPILVEIFRGIVLVNPTVAKSLPYQGMQAITLKDVRTSAPRLDLQAY